MNERPDGQDISALFHEVVELAADQRARLYRERGIPDSLRDEVEALLGEEPLGAFADGAMSSAGQRIADELGPAGPRVHWTRGTRVGDYEIVREIARGGMGVVFEARQVSLGRQVAIKVIRGVQLADSADQQRFRAEAEAIAQLEHVGIVPVYEVAEHEGLQFYSMAYLGGGSLKDLETPLDPARATELMAEVCDAIHYAHTRNIVHRDLKPANVLLSDSLRPRVSDFGLAKDTSSESDLTRTGAVLGTPGFMAPEQAAGDMQAVGHLADVYGLGAILFHLLTGHAPIEGEHLAEILHKVLHEDAPDPRRHVASVPLDLASICRKALEKEPVRRYDSAAAMATDLRRFLRGEALLARPLGNRERLARWCSRHRALAASIGAAALAVVGGAATATWFALEANQKAEELAVANTTMQEQNVQLAAANATMETQNAELAAANSTMEAQNAQLEGANAKMQEQNAALVAAQEAAETARGDAEAFSDFLIEDVIRTARPRGSSARALGLSVTVLGALKAAAEQIPKRFEGRPLAGALAQKELAVTFRHCGYSDLACDLLRECFETRRRELGANDYETLNTMNSLGVALFTADRTPEAIEIFEDLTTRTEVHAPGIHRQAMENLAVNYEKAGRYAQSIEILQAALELPDLEPRNSAKLLAKLALAHAQAKRPARAREILQQVYPLLPSPQVDGYGRLQVEMEVMNCLEVLGDDEQIAQRGVAFTALARDAVSPLGQLTIYWSDATAKSLAKLERWEEAATELTTTIAYVANRNQPGDRARIERAAAWWLRAGDTERALGLATIARDRWQQSMGEPAELYRAEALLCEAMIAAGRTEQARSLLLDRLPRLEARPQDKTRAQRRIAAAAKKKFLELRDRL